MSVPSISFYPPLPPGAALRRPFEELPYPLGEDDCFLLSRGRHAIWQAAQSLGLGPGAAVLAPAWHHGAEIEALRAAGAAVDFYDLDSRLEPDEDELEELLAPQTRALFITHFLGFPQDGRRWREWCDARGLLLFEDAAHACLTHSGSQPAGAFGDAAIWCLFKSFAVPDGAALRLARGAPDVYGERVRGSSAAARRQALWLLQRSPALARAVGRESNGRSYDHMAEIRLGDARTPPTAATEWLIPRVADAGAAAKRRANYAMLLDELGAHVPAPFDRLQDGAVPLGMPLLCPDKRGALNRLATAGIDAVDFWSEAHPLLERERFPHADELRRATVLLPVHQELRPLDLERIADAARARPARSNELRIEIADSVGELAGEWSELALRMGSVFATPEWAETWCRHFLDDRPLRLACFREPGGRLVAILPMYVYSAAPLTVLRLVGHGPGEELGPVCAPADRARVARALRRSLSALGADLLLAEHVTRETGWSAMTGARVLRTEGSPAVRVAVPVWESFLASRSRRLRKELRRSERKLAEVPGFQLRDASAAPDGFDAFLALHNARWDHESRFLDHESFHRDFAAIASERGWLRLVFLEATDHAIAATYGFRYAGVEFDYQGGRDPDWSDGSPGLVLIAEMIRSAFDAGIREYRLLRGSEWYKTRFATEDRGLETFALGSGALGAMAAAIAANLPGPVSRPLGRRLRA